MGLNKIFNTNIHYKTPFPSSTIKCGQKKLKPFPRIHILCPLRYFVVVPVFLVVLVNIGTDDKCHFAIP